MAEWSIAPVLKTGEPQGSVGSNPTSSASVPSTQSSFFSHALSPPVSICFSALAFAALLAATPVASGAEISPEKKSTGIALNPNIVFIIADQWRAQAFGHTGDANARTPNLDALAATSANFVNAVCSPTRASLLTGQRAITHGVFMNDTPLEPDAVTLAKVLRDAGYDTGAIGKWHIDGSGSRSAFIPKERRQGFDYWRVLDCTHDYNHSAYYGDTPEKKFREGYDAIAQTRDAEQFIRSHAKSEKPFLLWLAWGPPHDPYQTAPEKYRAMFHAAELKLRANVPEAIRPEARKMLAGYYAHCTALDDCVGDLVRTLREAGLEKNTVVVFTADHGDLLGSHGGQHKQQPFDESVRVPMVLRWPDKIAPGKITAPIGTDDVMPTLLGLCGVKIPKSVEGRDFSAHLRDKADAPGDAALIVCVTPFGQWIRANGGREYRGIRTARHTYVRSLDGPWLLFDNQTDPFQMKNLAGLPEAAELQAALDTKLKKMLAEAHDEFLPAADYIRERGYQVNETGTVRYKP